MLLDKHPLTPRQTFRSYLGQSATPTEVVPLATLVRKLKEVTRGKPPVHKLYLMWVPYLWNPD
jgi:hypothetical protein